MAIDNITDAKDLINENYEDFLAYIKTFNESEFGTIYCEREWRSTRPFNFSIEDIAIIILPKQQDGINFYEKLLSETTLPKTLTVAAWEDLIEH